MKSLVILALFCVICESVAQILTVHVPRVHGRGTRYPDEVVLYKREVSRRGSDVFRDEYPENGYEPGDFKITRVELDEIGKGQSSGIHFSEGGLDATHAKMEVKSMNDNGFVTFIYLYGVYIGRCHVPRTHKEFLIYSKQQIQL